VRAGLPLLDQPALEEPLAQEKPDQRVEQRSQDSQAQGRYEVVRVWLGALDLHRQAASLGVSTYLSGSLSKRALLVRGRFRPVGERPGRSRANTSQAEHLEAAWSAGAEGAAGPGGGSAGDRPGERDAGWARAGRAAPSVGGCRAGRSPVA